MHIRDLTKLPRRFATLVVMMLASASLLMPLSTAHAQPAQAPTQSVAQKYGDLPLSFVPNLGQTDAAAKFQVRSAGGNLIFSPSQIVLSLANQTLSTTSPDKMNLQRDPNRAMATALDSVPAAPPTVVRLQFDEANPTEQIAGADKLAGIVNYFIGNDPAKWHTNVPTYLGVVYKNLYPGIDLSFEGREGSLKGTYVVAPDVDPTQIRWHYSGARAIHLDPNTNDLLIDLPNNKSLTERAPDVWQNRDGQRQSIAVRYTLSEAGEIGFAVSHFDTTLPLVIDPTLVYSTYLGGSDADNHIAGIAVNSNGNTYIVGYTQSTNFPTANAFQSTFGGINDVFVTELNTAGNGLVYSTYLGGSNQDVARDIAIDNNGNAYVTGVTNSTNFPTVNGFQSVMSGSSDAFITKLNAAGNGLVYSTYLGGNDSAAGEGITVDASGNTYVTGGTTSSNFPAVNPVQSALGGVQNAFITKLNAAGSALVYSTYLGGSGNDTGSSIAVDSGGNAYVTGSTVSTNFPTANAFQPTFGGGSDDAFITKLNAAGSALVYSTYLGGTGSDDGSTIKADSSGNAYVTGGTVSTNFPTANAYQSTYGGGADDVFITKLNAAGSALVYSSYLGKSGNDVGSGIAIDSGGNAYISGFTDSTNFPTVNAIQPTFGGGGDAFVTELNAAGSALVYSTYLGGSANDASGSIAVDSAGNAYITGYTSSTNFPTANAYQNVYQGGSSDVFIAKIGSPSISFTPPSGPPGTEVTITGVDTNFFNALDCRFNGLTSNCAVDSATQIRAIVPNGATTGPIAIVMPDGNIVSSTDFVVLPETPSSLTATVFSPSRIDLSWSDNSSTETAYKIERSPDGSTNWTEIDSVAADQTSYQNTPVTCGASYYYRVRAFRSTDGTYSNYSNTASITLPCALNAVTLSAPPDGTLTSNNTPTFTWLAVGGADTYEIQVDNNSDFSSPEQDHTGPDLSYTATTLADGATYFWQVRALRNNNTDMGPWSTPWTLVINHVTLPPPTLSLPAVNANVAVTKPTFTWVAVTGAAKYNLQIDDDPTFASPPPVHALGKVTTYAAQLTDNLQYGTTYYWRVQAGDASNVFGDWSGIRAFTVTLQKTPTNGAYSTSTLPTFTWAAVTGATAYDFEVSSDATFATTPNDTYSGRAISHMVPLAHALSSGPHYWRVRVTTSGGTSPWMGPWTLIVTPTLPAAPAQLLPAVNALTSNATPDFSWKPTVTSGHFTYQIQIATASTFYGPVQDVVLPIDTTNYTALTLPDGVYYWRVRAINSVNATGAWSTKRPFTVNTTPAPKLTAPKDWSGTTSSRPTFSWSAFAGAQYTLQVFINNGTCSTSQYSKGNLTAASYTLPLANALPAGEYCWNVLATDALGHAGTPSPFFHFTVNANVTPPAVPSLISPATASLWTPSSIPDLTWTGPAGDTFEVQIDTVTTFTHPVQDAITVVDGHTFTVSSLSLPAGLYYWHVRTINSQGIASAYAAMRSFTLKTAIPAAPNLLLPAQNGITPSLHPTLSWQAVTGAKSYILLVATDASFTTLVADQAVLAPAVSYAMTTETLDYAQTYYWQVQAVDAVGNTSLPSSTFHFTVTIQTAPVNGSSTALVRPTFQWQAVSGAFNYQLQLASDAAFSNIFRHYDNLQVTKFTIPPSDSLSPGTYYWRVLVATGSGPTLMPGWSLAETTGTVGIPVLSTPATKAITNDNTPTFNWKAAISAQKYEIEIASTSTFVSPQVDAITAPGVLTYIPAVLADGTYYWRVRSINSYGATSTWSAVWSLTIDTVLPAAPDLLGPANNTITTNPALTLRWNAVAGAAKYEVAIGTSNPPTTPPIPLGNVTTYLISPTLAQSDYFWQVRAIDAAGNVGPWSTPTRKFIIAAGMSSASVKPTFAPPTNTPSAVATDEPTVAPTFAPPTNTPVAASATPIQLMTVEAESTSVTRTGNWTAENTSNASGGAYLFSSGQAGDALTLGFSGTYLDIIFVKHPAFGSFAVEIDGVLLQNVDAHATQSAFGAQLTLDNLASGAHTLRVYAINGAVALDAFRVEAVTTSTQQSTPDNAPTIGPTFAPPTNTPQPTSTPLAP